MTGIGRVGLCWVGVVSVACADPSPDRVPDALPLPMQRVLGEPGDVVVSLGDDASMNWTDMHVRVLGRSGSMANARAGHRLAEQDATDATRRRMSELAHTVRVRGGLTVGEAVEDASGVASEAWTVAVSRYTVGRAAVDVVGELDMGVMLQPWTLKRAATRQIEPVDALSRAPTGLVLDARGLDVQPVWAPRVTDASGELLWDAVVWSDLAQAVPPMVWVADPTHPAMSRVGDRPELFIVAGARHDGLVLSDTDAARFRARSAGTRALGEGAVVVIVDP